MQNPKIKQRKVVVFKFGGASIKDASSIINVSSIIKKFPEYALLIVVSALGKTTNVLEQILKARIDENEIWKNLLKELEHSHLKIVSELNLDKNLLSSLFNELESNLQKAEKKHFDFHYDQIIIYGEMLSTTIVSSYLQKINFPIKLIDARDIIKTDNNYRDVNIQLHFTQKNVHDVIKPILKGEESIVTQGFIGSNSEGFSTTLGREGSDYSAAILAHCLHASYLMIWKDVDGVMNADPKQFADAEKIPKLSYLEAIEMAFYGAKIIHPKTIKPLENTGIPLVVRSFENLDDYGTKISKFETEIIYPPIKVLKQNQVLLSIQTRDFSFISEKHLQHIFKTFSDFRIHQNIMQNGAISYSCCVDDNSRLEEALKILRKEFKILTNDNLQLLTIRHYNEKTLEELTQGKQILLEQKSRQTIQFVLK